jgi:class 3 adenylate cyclase/predicted ATPase
MDKCRKAGGTAVDVAAWLRGLGLERYEQAFRDNDVDADVLPELTAEDLIGLGVGSIGHRRKLLAAIAALRRGGSPPETEVPPGPSTAGTVPIARSPEAERRQLTVLFADLVGSTALSARLDPEEMREVLRAYQDAVAGGIARFEGHVAKFMGDGVLAYFGWPCADEDDAERAVRAGLAIAEAVGRLAAPAGEPLAARVGIASGLAVVGDLLGEGAAREEAIVGETPNLAARLQEAAPPGSVVIADGTRRLLGEVFVLRAFGPRRLKGFASPVSGFRVLGERPADSRFEARRPGSPPPMVGRDQELALLLERWRQAQAGEGQAVLLVGEAGIGKSRLVRATLDALAGDEVTVLRYQCSPHHTGTALWPVARQLAHAAGIEPADTEAAKLDKLKALLRQGARNVGAAVPLVAAMLGIDASARYPTADLTPQQRRSRTLAVLVEQLLGLARRQPVLMVLEDVHWIDPTTLELVGQALDRIADARVLLLLTARPDHQPALGGHPQLTRLTLNRLARGPTGAIVGHLAHGRPLPPGLLDEIAARSDGVPLFAEELTKAVLEAGTAGVAVPASLHASLMARLDRVPGVKEVAQVAACIGREFAYPLLAAVSPLPEAELLAALDRLAAAELVFRRGEPPEASYSFKHALVRDAAHESLLKAQRQRLHARIAGVLAERAPETAEMEPELLARHYTEAGLAEQAVDHWQRAGQKALARSAMAEAVAHLTHGLELLEQLPEGPPRQRRELALQLALGQASIAAKGFAAPETGRAYAQARVLCRELGDVPEFFPALYGHFIVEFQRGELAVAHEAARELLQLAVERGDAAARVTGHRIVGSALYHLGRLAESRAHLEQGLALYTPDRDRGSAFVYALDSRVVCLFWLVHVLFAQGYPEQAQARMQDALAYARELAHSYTLAYAQSVACFFRGRYPPDREARTEADALVAFASEQGFPLPAAVGTAAGGWALMHEEAIEEGLARMRQGLASYMATDAQVWVPELLLLLARGHARAGQPAAGLGVLAEALRRVEANEGRWLEAELHRLRGKLLLALPDPDPVAAETCLRRAVMVAREQGAAMWELRAATSLARLWRGQGRGREGRELLAAVLGRFTEGFATPDLREAQAVLGTLP